jgi:hypothetical protein
MVKVAILFFGLTRTLNKTYSSIKKNLLDVLQNADIEYDTFMHTYTIEGQYVNFWTQEFTQSYDNNQYKLLNPTYIELDNQKTIIEQINFEQYYTKLGNWTGMSEQMTKYLIRNMVLALYSKKRITEVFEKQKDNYDYVIIMRPDIEILNMFDVKYFKSVNDTTVIIPEKHSFSGCNDRMIICTVNNGIYYGKLLDNLLDYSKNKSIISERYLFDMINDKQLKIEKVNIDYEMIRM